MAELPKVKYSGTIREIPIGKAGCELTLGGETAYSFCSFEGNLPHVPKLALQILDIEPEDWAPDALEPFKDVAGDPVAWAKKCVDVYKADAVCLLLAGTDPNGMNLSAQHAADVSKAVAEAVNVPLIVWGVSSDEKNVETLKAVAEVCSGLNIVIGPVTENNYKQIGAAALAYNHVIAASSPIDINLAKQLNILLENLGVSKDKILIDPTTGSVGYGLEYCYSIMERIRQAALTQNDDKLQYPILNIVGEEVWKVKEAKLPTEDDPKLGDAAVRAVNLEAITALSVLQAGSDLLVLRHPKTLEYIRQYLAHLMVPTDLVSMGLDLSLSSPGTSAAEEKKSSSPAVEEPTVHEASVKELKPEIQAEPPVTSRAFSRPEPESEPGALAAEAALQAQALQLTAAEVQDLKEMAGLFKAVKGLIAGSETAAKREEAAGPAAPAAAHEQPLVTVAAPMESEMSPMEAARSFVGKIAAAAAARVHHGRQVAQTFLMAVKGDPPDNQIKDLPKLLSVAADIGVATQDREIEVIALEIGEKAQGQYGNQYGEIYGIKRAPDKRQQIWRDQGVIPAGIDRSIVEALQTAHAETTLKLEDLVQAGTRCALADGWGGSIIAADISDILYGTPTPMAKKAKVEQQEMITGFSQESFKYVLGGTFRAGYGPLNENIISGRVRGLAGILGCSDSQVESDLCVSLAKELIKNDILVLATGVAANALGKAGLLIPEAAAEFAGHGLAEFCEMIGIPPCLHLGASHDNCGILLAGSAIVREGGLGDDISDIPAVGIVPEWQGDKAASIVQCFAASGLDIMLGAASTDIGPDIFTHDLFQLIETMYGAKLEFAARDPHETARRCTDRIDSKRKALGIDKARERVLMDMAMRREIA